MRTMNPLLPEDASPNQRSIETLFERAYTSADDDEVWQAINRLRSIATEAVFTEAVRHCRSSEARRRRVGVDVIAQLGIPALTYHEPAVALLVELLEAEHDPDVLESIAFGLGHRDDARAIVPLLAFAQHPDERVRHGVAFGLLGHTDPLAIDALIALSQDVDAEVRDWATFGLAVQIDTDTPAIRTAMVARLDDEEENVAGEAMVGLARRKDRRVVAPLLEVLQSDDVGSLPLEAAAALADPVLLPALQRLNRCWVDQAEWEYRLLQEAIAACTSPTAV